MSHDINNSSERTQEGDLVQLVSPTNKVFFVRLKAGGQFQTHRGTLQYDDLIDQPWGSEVHSHMGSVFFMLQPGLTDILKETKRNTQIMYTKDIGFILMQMSIGPGTHVLEAGTGSGALTTALAWAVGPQGRVTTYEARPEMQNLARKNLQRLGLAERVEFKLRDVAEGFDERNVDALFYDLPSAYDYIPQAHQALKPGGHFGALMPTTNQVSTLVAMLQREDFAFIDVCELILRYYKPVPARLRPTDRMVAHTGYLIFGRAMLPSQKPVEAIEEAGEEVRADELEGLDEGEEADVE